MIFQHILRAFRRLPERFSGDRKRGGEDRQGARFRSIAIGRVRIIALAVASEPYLFWKGDGSDEIIAKIQLPEGAGRLDPAASNLNGPSGVTLDEGILAPLGLSRADAWLCDLLGDQPIKHWLRHYDGRWKKLSEFGPYGQLHDIRIAGRRYHVLPLAHPRQVGTLGTHSDRWFEAHKAWRVEAGTMFRG